MALILKRGKGILCVRSDFLAFVPPVSLNLETKIGTVWLPVCTIEGRQLVLCLCVTQVNNDYIITKRPFGDGFWSAASAAQLSWK